MTDKPLPPGSATFEFFFEEEKKRAAASVERALILVLPDGESTSGIFLLGYGHGIESDLEAGLDRIEIGPTTAAPADPGFWIWEGVPLWIEERSEGILEGCVPYYDKRGTWRRPTSEEMNLVVYGNFKQFLRQKEVK